MIQPASTSGGAIEAARVRRSSKALAHSVEAMLKSLINAVAHKTDATYGCPALTPDLFVHHQFETGFFVDVRMDSSQI